MHSTDEKICLLISFVLSEQYLLRISPLQGIANLNENEFMQSMRFNDADFFRFITGVITTMLNNPIE
jgi:hypothetical protein